MKSLCRSGSCKRILVHKFVKTKSGRTGKQNTIFFIFVFTQTTWQTIDKARKEGRRQRRQDNKPGRFYRLWASTRHTKQLNIGFGFLLRFDKPTPTFIIMSTQIVSVHPGLCNEELSQIKATEKLPNDVAQQIDDLMNLLMHPNGSSIHHRESVLIKVRKTCPYGSSIFIYKMLFWS